MKKFIVILAALMPMFVWAQTVIEVDSTQIDSLQTSLDSLAVEEDTIPEYPCIFDSLTYVRVYQDSTIYALLHDKRVGEENRPVVIGYRVQVFSSNRQQVAKTEAIELQKKLERSLSVEVYAQYISPFWKVRIGNFLTYEEAKQFKESLLTQYPSLIADTYIVKDQINVRP